MSTQNIGDNFRYTGGRTPFDAKTYLHADLSAAYQSLSALINSVSAGSEGDQFVGNTILDLTTGTMAGRRFRLRTLRTGGGTAATVEIADNRRTFWSNGAPTGSGGNAALSVESFDAGGSITEVVTPRNNDICIDKATGDIYWYDKSQGTYNWQKLFTFATLVASASPAYTAGSNITIDNRVIALASAISGLTSLSAQTLTALTSITLGAVQITSITTSIGESGSDAKLPTEKAVRSAIDAVVASIPIYIGGTNITIDESFNINLDDDITLGSVTLTDLTGTPSKMAAVDSGGKIVQAMNYADVVTKTGTPVAQRVPYWSDVNILSSSSYFTFNPSTGEVSVKMLKVPLVDGSTGFYADTDNGIRTSLDIVLGATIDPGDVKAAIYAATGYAEFEKVIIGTPPLSSHETYALWVERAASTNGSYFKCDVTIQNGMSRVVPQVITWANANAIDLDNTPSNILTISDSMGSNRTINISNMVAGASYLIFMSGGDDAKTITLGTGFSTLDGSNVFTPASNTVYAFTGVAVNVGGGLLLYGVVDIASKNLIA